VPAPAVNLTGPRRLGSHPPGGDLGFYAVVFAPGALADRGSHRQRLCWAHSKANDCGLTIAGPGASSGPCLRSKPVRLRSSKCFPAYPQQRTFVGTVGTPVQGQSRHFALQQGHGDCTALWLAVRDRHHHLVDMMFLYRLTFRRRAWRGPRVALSAATDDPSDITRTVTLCRPLLVGFRARASWLRAGFQPADR
jgi:hypothetical protein